MQTLRQTEPRHIKHSRTSLRGIRRPRDHLQQTARSGTSGDYPSENMVPKRSGASLNTVAEWKTDDGRITDAYPKTSKM